MKIYHFEAQGVVLNHIVARNIKQALNKFAIALNFLDWNNMLKNAKDIGGNNVQVFVTNKHGYSTEIKHLKA